MVRMLAASCAQAAAKRRLPSFIGLADPGLVAGGAIGDPSGIAPCTHAVAPSGAGVPRTVLPLHAILAAAPSGHARPGSTAVDPTDALRRAAVPVLAAVPFPR